MKIKSLLLGSAAALVLASGAKAADAIVDAEPDPPEFVRICDAYGSGFFYIPGTETCLSISGYVWFQAETDSRSDDGTTPYYDGGQDKWGISSRARVNFDARSDTEWGTLRGFIRLQATWTAAGTGDGPVSVDQAFMEIGGLRIGYTESAWAQTQGGGATNWGSHSWGGMYYGYSQAQLIAYTFQGGNGFFGTVSIEDDGSDNYTPDAIVKIGVNQGWGAVWVKAGFDEENSTDDGDGMAAALGLQLNVPNQPGSSLRVLAFYSDNRNAYTVGSEYSLLVSYNHAFSSTFRASLALQYGSNVHASIIDGGLPTDSSAYGGELSVVWFPVTNFEVRTELHYDDSETADDGTASGILRFTRYF